ncbi:hypothetical protein HAX54_044956 [Datura stramonium]|uniref:Uncharacterized protein n=1 Tax=Datura stramonium TaxID=4076 RepID=A0ABS8SQ01_DATST|nr:hypothetical protein [Datura stramonium]
MRSNGAAGMQRHTDRYTVSCPAIKPVVADTFLGSFFHNQELREGRDATKKSQMYYSTASLMQSPFLRALQLPKGKGTSLLGRLWREDSNPRHRFVATCPNPLSYRPHPVSTGSVPGVPSKRNLSSPQPFGGREPVAVSAVPLKLWGSRNRRALILGWVYYLDEACCYPYSGNCYQRFTGHDNCQAPFVWQLAEGQLCPAREPARLLLLGGLRPIETVYLRLSLPRHAVRALAPPTAWELTVSCSISLPDGGSSFAPFPHGCLLPAHGFSSSSKGCPIRESPDLCFVFNSLKHFVDYYALPHLWVPRYPPVLWSVRDPGCRRRPWGDLVVLRGGDGLGHPDLNQRLAREVIIAPTVQLIGRESIDSFSGAIHPSRTQHTTLRCTALSKCACSPFFLTLASLCEITPMRRKKKALRDPPGPTLDTLRSFFKPAPISISSQEKNGSNGNDPLRHPE